MIFFSADQHFGHYNERTGNGILKYCNRPFTTITEMDNELITRWNEQVGQEDFVYILGDFAWKNPESYLKVLAGKKFLVIGDHDNSILNSQKFKKDYFAGMSYLHIIEYDNTTISLCHWCLRTWKKSHYNQYHLYAHSHNRLPPIGKSHDVGVDANNFRPISIEEVMELMKTKEDNPNLIR